MFHSHDLATEEMWFFFQDKLTVVHLAETLSLCGTKRKHTLIASS